jgi:hypothetical protein
MKLVLVITLLLAFVSGCGGGSPSVKCADVWAPGETLPKGYDGCDGKGFKAINGKCDDGSTYFGVHTSKTELFALPGKTVVDEDGDSKSYDKFFSQCFSDGPRGLD